jgi:hypothetical protein
MTSIPWTLSPDRCFHADPAQRDVARELYASVKDLPIVSPHGHVPPALLADPGARLGTPAELFIIPDHYIMIHPAEWAGREAEGVLLAPHASEMLHRSAAPGGGSQEGLWDEAAWLDAARAAAGGEESGRRTSG